MKLTENQKNVNKLDKLIQTARNAYKNYTKDSDDAVYTKKFLNFETRYIDLLDKLENTPEMKKYSIDCGYKFTVDAFKEIVFI